MQFSLYGNDHDPNPDIESIRRKLRRRIIGDDIEALAGPYDYLQTYIRHSGVRFSGKYECPEEYSASPLFEQELYPESFRSYIDNGEYERYCMQVGKLHAENFKHPGIIPVLIGVDHAVTGGVLDAVQADFKDLKLVIFDAHFDGYSPAVRNALVGYARETFTAGANFEAAHQFEYFDEGFIGGYDTGSFLFFLMQRGVLKPENIIIFGVRDLPDDSLRDDPDMRLRMYFEEYDAFVSKGGRIYSADMLAKSNNEILSLMLKGALENENVYLSIDADVFSGLLGGLTRYGDGDGINFQKFFDILTTIDVSSNKVIGLDLMELDITKWDNEIDPADICIEVQELLSDLINIIDAEDTS